MRRHQFNSWEEILDVVKQLVQAKKYLKKAEDAKNNEEKEVEVKIGKKKIILPVDEAIKKLGIVKIVSLDTINQAIQYVKEYLINQENIKRLEKNKDPISTFNEVGWGRDESVQREIMKVINDLRDSGYGVIYISHIKDKKNNKGTEQEYIEIVPDLQDVERNWIIGAADIYLQIDEESITVKKAKFDGEKLIEPAEIKKQRYIYLRGNEKREAGLRFKYVPEKIEFDEEDGFNYLEEVFKEAVHKEIEESMNDFDLDEEKVTRLKLQQKETKETKEKEIINEHEQKEEIQKIENILETIKDISFELKRKGVKPSVINNSWTSVGHKDPTKVKDIETAQKILDNLNNIKTE
jgi:hypothetical protein